MRRRLIALAALIACGTAAAQDIAELYVRGAFNGWGTASPLIAKGKGVYQADILVSPGNHAFKLGTGDWGREWVIDPDKSTSVAPDQAYGIEQQSGPETFLFVRRTGTYRFTVDASHPGKPVLKVARIADAQPANAPDPHAGHTVSATQVWPTWDGKQETVRYSTPDATTSLRRYVQSSTMALRDPGPQHVEYAEQEGLPRVRSGNLAFDALFALAGAEMRLNSVSQIKDGNYNGGQPIGCDCFSTGEKWAYVWTRDLSYAADLGLALLDPQRVRNSLDFKLSGWRPGIKPAAQIPATPDGLQIVQDTGSGGSWPVSTDRLTWAFAAEETLRTLPAAERAAFAARALKALSNTIDIDRVAAFDTKTGLYTGEQSYLDWRDQTYAAWIPGDLASMASSKALSTNVVYYQALRLAAKLAREHKDAPRAQRYEGWAADLKRAINERLWLQDAGMYSSLTAGHLDDAPLHKFDWLGQALAIVTGVADDKRAASILAHYPHGPMGAPMIWPQQIGAPIYHNRSIWPFVTAYGLRAAASAGNAAVADTAYDSLMRGAAVNLSNMENLEWLSGQPLLLDEKNPSLIGPVINSRRQLWSVGGYLGMVIENVFGVTAQDDGIALRPFVTAKLRRDTFGDTDRIMLQDLRLHGKRIEVLVRLPAASQGSGYYAVERIVLNGKPAQQHVRLAELGESNRIEITLGKLVTGQDGIRRVKADPYVESSVAFGPREPVVSSLERLASGGVKVGIGAGGNAGDVTYSVYRDGKPVASGLKAGEWLDRQGGAASCYALEARHTDSGKGGGNYSHHSMPRCVDAGIEIPVSDARVASNLTPTAPDARFTRPHLAGWGQPNDRFTVERIAVTQPGSYRVQVRYHNGANQVNLGVSNGVKWLALKDASGKIVAQGVIQLPHAPLYKANTPSVYSTPLAAQLTAGSYRVELTDFFNMSYLESNRSFSGAGGKKPSNRFDIYGVRLLRVNP
ncbi:esterase [Massilia sp. YIM B02443]|uniref:MGH1-like glycoside hydrolase domain-containing protein n=1 Tax=Massilia sp. YIM B02443 TaxID=3050127 RepID=UPI0025B6805C|nr:esterase [Massilia sp. YIM B02443]MDN4035571.1 esterase [Massilia sp. YIM B02443]